MKGLILAIQFLTRIPISIEIDIEDHVVRQSIFWFTWISFFIGLISGFVTNFLQNYSQLIGAFLGLLVWIALTGGLHLDGYTDTVDGFSAQKNKEETLKIMSDSLIGSFGVLGLILLILGKLLLLYEVQLNMWELAIICGSSRLAVTLVILFFPPAKDRGMGNFFWQSRPKKEGLFSLIVFFIIVWLIDIKYLIILGLLLLVGYIIGRQSLKKIGGVTGDIYGFTMEISEFIGLIILWGVNIWI